nr:MAG TPA: hypothetical protein [Bacteriophage sp.]
MQFSYELLSVSTKARLYLYPRLNVRVVHASTIIIDL